MTDHQFRIGMGQLLVEGGEPERNLERATEIIKQAADCSCDCLLLPETLDLTWTHPSAKTEAKPIPGPYSDILCQQAQKHGLFICAGLTELAGSKVYNTAILVNDSGEIILKYRKINVLDVGKEFYAIGQSLSVVETPFGMVGVNICSDNYIDAIDIGYTLARMGAQLILSPSSWTVDYTLVESDNPYGEKWLKPYHHLAKMFNLTIVNSSSVGVIHGGPYEGKKMVGCSLAVNAKGVIVQSPYNEFAGNLVTADIEIYKRLETGTDIGVMLKQKKGLLKI
jgi:predicted amidohydrolase